jgi:hypothetical protein
MKKKKKTDKQIAKSDSEKAQQALALGAAIDAVVEMAGVVKSAIQRLFDKSDKKAVYLTVTAYVKPGTDEDYKRYTQVAAGVKDVMHFNVMPDGEKAHLSDMLRNFREKLGVKARKTKKRKTATGAAPKDRGASVILPEVGKTDNERIALVMQVMTALDNALGTTRQETVALIIKAAEVSKAEIKKNKAA